MVDVANVKALLLLVLLLVWSVGVIGFLAGYCVGRFGQRGRGRKDRGRIPGPPGRTG